MLEISKWGLNFIMSPRTNLFLSKAITINDNSSNVSLMLSNVLISWQDLYPKREYSIIQPKTLYWQAASAIATFYLYVFAF